MIGGNVSEDVTGGTFKKDSKDPAEKQRLSVLEETLRQMNKYQEEQDSLCQTS